MACFIVPTTYHRQFPVNPILRRRFHPYQIPGQALANAMLEDIVKLNASCDNCLCQYGSPRLAKRKHLAKRTLTKQTEKDGKKELYSEPVTELDNLEQSLIEPSNFKLAVEVGNVSPDDLNAKLSDGVLTVTGKSMEADIDGNVKSMYSFTREFTLPEDVDVDSLTSKLTADGVLTFEAPFLTLGGPTERYLPITVDKTDVAKEPASNKLNEETKPETELSQLQESLTHEEKHNVADAEH
ncbi:uncharacterized protein LOC102805184 [Saccoglossus kowalevskii]|uniref:Uncharacterized protein LOC102805184 n=1 Tax=Saccoglossus kowalevskii TaxID=10224 RepID=A0ABM0MYB5_SACKO|nr:PREDICTED: uncharacterized protein LOC102805184 [Saccoglossus kowalevskii]